MRVLLPALVLASGAAGPAVVPVHVEVEIAGQASATAGGAALVAEPGDGSDAIRAEVAAPGKTALELPAAGKAWQVRVEAAGFWSAPQTLAPGQPQIRFRLLPAGTLQGRVVVPPNQPSPAALSVRFLEAPRFADGKSAFEGTVECPVHDGGVWTCGVPAGHLDLRLRARGFTSVYQWGRPVEAGKALDLGLLQLQPGTSVVGWVQTASGPAVSKEAKVTLSPRALGRSGAAEDDRRLAARAFTAEVSERGFFHFAGVPAGSYIVTATQPGFAPASTAAVEVLAGLETEIQAPLVLQPPAELVVRLVPALSPFGERWRLRLFRTGAGPQNLEAVAEGQATEEGSWNARNLASGPYQLWVEDTAGARWVHQEVAVDPGAAPLEIAVPLVEVRGRARVGKAPLAAALWFGDAARRRIRFDSDAEGRFDGFLPAEGIYQVRLESEAESLRMSLGEVEVRVRPGKRVADVEIALPDTRLRGKVVDDAGRPVPGAAFTAMSLGERRAPHQGMTGEAGTFEVRGLPEGRLALAASFEELESEWAEVALTEGQEGPEVQLTLRRQQPVRGRVTAAGNGIPGARILPLPDFGAVPVLHAAPLATDATGGFELRLPPGTPGLTLVVMAPGFALRLVRILATAPPDPLEIAVEPNGGDLILDLPSLPEPGAPRAPRPVLLRDGLLVPWQLLGTWASFQGQPPADPTRLVVPQVEAGEYLLCPARAAADGGTAGCARGYLAPGGELHLRLPEAG